MVVMPDARIIVADAVVTHPAAATFRTAAARTSRSAAEKAAAAKRASFAELSAGGNGYRFVPLAVKTYGTLGHEAAKCLSELGDAVAADGRVSKEKYVRGMRQELSCALARCVALGYHRALGRVAQCVGSHFQAGSDVPLQDPGEL
jgi:hypothetical protein